MKSMIQQHMRVKELLRAGHTMEAARSQAAAEWEKAAVERKNAKLEAKYMKARRADRIVD